MRNKALSQTKAIVIAILCTLFGTWVLYSQVQQDSEHRKLKSFGQSADGILIEATRHSVNFIPMGYSFQISYSGQSKKFDVSKHLFYSHVNSEGKFKVNERIKIVFMPDHPKIAELPEMLDLWAWWTGGPLVNYPFGVILLLGSVQIFRNRRGGRLE